MSRNTLNFVTFVIPWHLPFVTIYIVQCYVKWERREREEGEREMEREKERLTGMRCGNTFCDRGDIMWHHIVWLRCYVTITICDRSCYVMVHVTWLITLFDDHVVWRFHSSAWCNHVMKLSRYATSMLYKLALCSYIVCTVFLTFYSFDTHPLIIT